MADDIDDLLDEVESKFCRQKEDRKGSSHLTSTSSSHPGLPQAQENKHSRKSTKSGGCRSDRARNEKDEINEAIEDIFQDDEIILEPIQDKPKKSQGQSVCESLKCFPVYVGGTRYLSGLATTASPRACDKLHCISCDNKVISFENFKWNESSSDYLFFRNNCPDFSRLKQSLLPSQGFRAYACQCSWRSAKQLEDLKKFSSLKWVCTKH